MRKSNQTLDIQTMADEFIATKSEKKFKALMDRLRPGVLKSIISFETDKEIQEEIINVTFAKAWANINQYSKDRGAFSTWIYRIAYTQCLQNLRHTSRTKSLDTMIEAGTVNESAYSVDAEFENFDAKPKYDVIDTLYQKTVDAIHSMKNEGKEGNLKIALMKWHIDKKPYKTIAAEMGIPENTAKNKVFRGKDMLRKILIEREPELVNAFVNSEY